MWWDHRPNSVESRLDATVPSAGKVVAGGRLNWGASRVLPTPGTTWCKTRGGSSRGRALRVSVCVILPLTMMVVLSLSGPNGGSFLGGFGPSARWSA